MANLSKILKTLKELQSGEKSIKKQINKIKETYEKSPVKARHISSFSLFMFNFLKRLFVGFIVIFGLLNLNFYYYFNKYVSFILSFILQPLFNDYFTHLVSTVITFILLGLILIFLIFPLEKENIVKISLITGQLIFIFLVISLILSAFNVMDVADVEVKGKLDLGFENFFTQVKKIYDDTTCLMSVECQTKRMKEKNTKKIETLDYSLSIDFNDFYKNDYYWQGEKEIEVPFVIKVKTSDKEDGSIYIDHYECFLEKEINQDSVLGKSKEEIDINEKDNGDIKENFITYNSEQYVSGSCIINDFNQDVEINNYKIKVKLYTKAKTICQYPFYFLNQDYFIEKNNIVFNTELNTMNKISYLLSNYKDKMKEELNINDDDLNKPNMYCTNDFYKVYYDQNFIQPFFNYDKDNMDFKLTLNIEKNEDSTLGDLKEGRFLELNFPQTYLSLNLEDSRNLIKSDSGYDFKIKEFKSNKNSFLIDFDLKNNVEDSYIDFLTFSVEGTFLKETTLNLKVINSNFKEDTDENTNEGENKETNLENSVSSESKPTIEGVS